MNRGIKTDQSTVQQGRLRADSNGYMPGLDGLRALAVFAVIAYHLDLSWAPGGLLGVSLFFVLSGYLITNILLLQWERDRSIDLKRFWIRRARRLLPALFVMLAGVMLWLLLCAPERLASLKNEVLAAVFYSSNWYLILHHVSYFESFGPPSPFGHLWSLAVEEQFYLFWPLLLGLGLRRIPRRKWVIGGTVVIALISAAAMALIYMPGVDPSRVYYGTDTRAFALLAGALLAMVWPSGKMSADLSARKRRSLDTVGSVGLLVVLLMIWKTNQYQPFLYRGGLLLFSAATACAIAAIAHPASYLGRIFGWRPLRWLGECSYGIYLWHYPVIALTSPAVNTGGPDLLRSLWQIGLSIALAALSRYLIEEPIRYGRRKRSPQRASDLPRRQRKPLVSAVRVSVMTLVVILVMSATANDITETSATALSENPVIGNQIQAPEEEAQTAEGETVAEDHEADPAPVAEEGNSEIADNASDITDDTVSDTADDIASDIKGDEITAIGDSLMLDVKPVLQKLLPGIVIDARIGRQMHEASGVISGLQKKGKLGKIVVIELGTNGAFTEKQLKQTLDALSGAEEVVLVNTRVPRPWESVVNEMLAKVSASYPNTTLIDWYSASGGHDDYFFPDGVHLNQKGAEACGGMIVETLEGLVNSDTAI